MQVSNAAVSVSFLLSFVGICALAQTVSQPAPQATPVAQPLTLSRAIEITLEKNPMRKAAMADQRAASAAVKEVRAVFLPRISFSETATRGNDPVYVFGSKLRQQVFTPADFALNALNTPTPLSNFSTKFGGQWNLFDSFANVNQFRRAQSMHQAAVAQLDRTDQELIFRTVSAYYGTLIAQKQLEVAEQSARTSQSILENTRNRYQAGVVVESDLLSAQVNNASRQQQLIAARNNLAFAQAQLSIALGLPITTLYQPSVPLAERSFPVSTLADLESSALHQRPDLKRIRNEEDAQEKSVSIAKAALGPRLNAFGSWQLDNRTPFAGGGGNNWIAGAELQFDLFAGGAKLAQVSREKAIRERVAAMRQSFEDQVRLEVSRAYYDSDSARQQVEVARTATSQAEESFRINQNRYQSGLATITDLLGVEEAMRRAQSDYWNAVYQYQISYANLQLATGMLNAQSLLVTP